GPPPGRLPGPELQEDGEDLLPQGIGDLPDGPQRLGLRLPPGLALGLRHAGTLLPVTSPQNVTPAASGPFRRFSDSFLADRLSRPASDPSRQQRRRLIPTEPRRHRRLQ